MNSRAYEEQVLRKMEQTKFNHGLKIINCDDVPDTISITSTPEHKKVKKPKSKRKRKIDFYNMDNLIITRKLKIKKKKIKCVININAVCERSKSIVRSAYNVCKKEAYYERIVPICLRTMCSGDDISSCCRSTVSRDYRKYRNPKAGSLSPVSSIALTDVNAVDNLSYEDVSNGSFSSDFEESEDELDTLIKRTKQRERQISHLYPAREYTSTPLSKVDFIPTPSPYSVDTDKKSIHSDNTMVLNPLSSEAYSPTASLDAIKMENDDATDIIDIDHTHSPRMTPDLIKIVNMNYSPVGRYYDNNEPYSPTFTPEPTIPSDSPDMLKMVRIDDDNVPYSPTYSPEHIDIDSAIDVQSHDMNTSRYFSSDFIKMENLDNDTTTNNEHRNVYSPTITQDMTKIENLNDNGAYVNDYGNVTYSPRCPTVIPDFHRVFTRQAHQQMHTEDPNMVHSAISTVVKQENMDDDYISTISNPISPDITIWTQDLIKREINEDCGNQPYSIETDYNMNNTINYKNETDDRERGRHNQVETNEIVVKIEKEEHINVNADHSIVFQNNVTIKTGKTIVKAEIL